MSLDYLRLISIDPLGIGNQGNGMINLIYSHLLEKYGLNIFKYIRINQIHQTQEIQEFVEIEKGMVHVNIIHNTPSNFKELEEFDQNVIRLDIIHNALCRLAKQEPRFDLSKLEKIRDEILSKHFEMLIMAIRSDNPKQNNVSCQILIHPQIKSFHFFIGFFLNDICEKLLPVYDSKPSVYSQHLFFSKMRWVDNSEIIISGAEKEIQIRFNIVSMKLSIDNMTDYDKPPLWEAGKSGHSTAEERMLYERWINSIPPLTQLF